MKKILPAIVLGVLVVGLVMPVSVSAQARGPQDCCKIHRTFSIGDDTFLTDDIVGPSADAFCTLGTPRPTENWGMVCLLNTIYSATDWFFYILIIISIILIIWGAFGILFGAGDPEKMTKGRTTVVYALVGIAIALFARVIPAVVKFMMGM